MIKNPAISGALFDFLAWAASQNEVLKLHGNEVASPAVQALTKWAKLRGLDTEDANVFGWNGGGAGLEIYKPDVQEPPDGVRCIGCSCEISEDDTPNVMIGKNPGQYCSRCVANGSIIKRGEGDWIYEPIIKEAV